MKRRFEYFRATKHLPTEEACYGWYRHFVDKRIPCAIVHHKSYTYGGQEYGPGYAVWIKGDECVAPRGAQNSEPLDGRIIMQSYKFEDLVGISDVEVQ